MKGELIVAEKDWLAVKGPAESLPMPFKHEVFLKECHVAGTLHVDDVLYKTKTVNVGTRLTLKRDVGNERDPLAICVETRFWRFPNAPQPRIATANSVYRELPLYVTYPEFVEAAGKFLNWERKVPSKDEVLRICRQIKVDQTDFLASVWMKDVEKAWVETLTPRFLFCSADTDEQYIWCEVRSAKGWDVWTFLLLAVDGCGSLLRLYFLLSKECKR